MDKENNLIPVFFAVDDGYIPFLAVTLESLLDYASEDNHYYIRILYTSISDENMFRIKKYEKSNVTIEFVDLNEYIMRISNKLYTRDYFSKATYYRLFIPDLYPNLDKIVYLDSDIVLLDDVANLYNIDIGFNLVGAVPDGAVRSVREFQDYVELVVGMSDYKNYFNAGILIMNLEELRKFRFQVKFLYLLDMIKFRVAQDQDYLNRLCKGRVKIIDSAWNTMPGALPEHRALKAKLVHFNLSNKPWHLDNVPFQDYFWKYAKKTEFYEEIKCIKDNYSEEQKEQDVQVGLNLVALAAKEADYVGDDRKKLEIMDQEKYEDRVKLLDKAKEYEKMGRFDEDTMEDPPAPVLMPDDIDYLGKGYSKKLKNFVATSIAEMFYFNSVRKNKIIIKDVTGLENLENLTTGGIITSNHFNPFEVFSVEKVFRKSKQGKKHKIYAVIREGNYTNFPGLYGFIFRNCDTLPLSSNHQTMRKFYDAVETILNKGDFILIYPEQSMWWNYQKPKPLKNGAYRFAVKHNVPIIPFFITTKESEYLDDAGFPVLEYYIHIEKPIYKDDALSDRENIQNMKVKNFNVWKNIYEEFYNKPLSYECDDEMLPDYILSSLAKKEKMDE